MLRPDDAAHLAEQATLGSLILQPHHLGRVSHIWGEARGTLGG